MRRTAAAVILIISLLLAVPAIAEPFEDATKTYDRGDYKTEYRLFKPLAEQGYAYAQDNLGVMYEYGQGVTQDFTEAVKWYREAADQGYASALSNLGRMYTWGRGVPQDYVVAHMWVDLAASRFPASEQKRRKIAKRNRDIVASKMTPAQIAEAQRLAQ